MVNWWFRSRWFGFGLDPLLKGIGILRGTQFESQTTGPQTTNPNHLLKHGASQLSFLKKSVHLVD